MASGTVLCNRRNDNGDVMDTVQECANAEGLTQIRVTTGGIRYCVRAKESRLWELLSGELVFPDGGERYQHPLYGEE